MALPADLLQAVSAPGGGKISLVIGAGCSVEEPTGLPDGRRCSVEVHRCLVADGILQNGDCLDPNDLSLVTDAVFAKRNSQRDVVERLCERFNLKLATPNEGYLIAAAMLCEGVISSVVTLNFDLALSTALSVLGAGNIGVIEGPEDLPRQRTINVYYLHRNANAANPDLWVLRTVTLQQDWREHWEEIIATKVLATPVVVFVGLGTPIMVLVESTRLLRNALPIATKLFQVDPDDMGNSRFFQELAIDPTVYIRCGWCQFMDELSQRLSEEQIDLLEQAVTKKVRDDNLRDENVVDLLARLQAIGLVNLGKVRANWLLDEKAYCPAEPNALGLIADLLLALAMVARVSDSVVFIVEDGLVGFYRDGREIAVYLVASGRGYRGRSAIEAKVDHRRKRFRNRIAPPRGAIVGGTSDWVTTVTPPIDVVRGDESGDIVTGPGGFLLFHISELRTDLNRIREVVP